MKATRVSAPGKTILMGEHAAVYGRLAVVATLGLRLRVRLEPGAAGDGVGIEIALLGHRVTESWSDLLRYTDEQREHWVRYSRDPSPGSFAPLRSDDPGRLVRLALGEAWFAIADDTAMPPPLALRIDSDLPIGAGFGSSAAAATAIVAALVATCVGKVDWDLVGSAVQEVERRQHGSPSGIDAATILHGGVLSARRAASEQLLLEPLQVPSARLGRVRIFDTGRPAEGTGEVVAGVRALRDRDPSWFDRQLDRMGELTETLVQALTGSSDDAARLMEAFRGYHRCLCRLGVVPEPVRELVRSVEDRGGAAKVSGAGSLLGPGAGLMLVAHPQADRIDEWEFLGDLISYPVAIGVEGVRVESIA